MNDESANKMVNEMADIMKEAKMVTRKEVEMDNPCRDIPSPQLYSPVTSDGIPRCPEQVLYIAYTNWKGESGWRRVIPLQKPMEFGSPFHVNQWIFRVYDLDKKAERSYALSGCERIISACTEEGIKLEVDAYVPWPEWKKG